MTSTVNDMKPARIQLLTIIALASVTVLVYFRVSHFEFVNFDDDAHVYQNPFVTQGWTAENLRWAFGIHGPSQWHPLAWISHQADSELYGLWPGGHHLTNLLLHVGNVIVLYLFFASVTASLPRSALIALVFAIHPLNVESVAWISERRNVLSLFFALLTLAAYARYVQRRSLGGYILVGGLFSLALMSKPLAVTLPCVMLLLDYWPFQRVGGFQPVEPSVPSAPQVSLRWLLLEKVPLFALSAGASLLTIWCQEETLASATELSIRVRCLNTLAAYGSYVQRIFWPSNLAVFYPHPGFVLSDPESHLAWPAVIGGIMLLGVTVWALLYIRTRPYLAVGWFWFVGTLVPMVGLVQVGRQQMADRYVYLPLIGFLVAVTWTIAEAAKTRHVHPSWLRLIAGSVVAACGILSWIQVGYWKDSVTLFEHTLSVTDNNSLAHNNLGLALSQRQTPTDQIVAHFLEALRITPDYGLARYNLGVVLHDRGYVQQAIPQFQESLRLNAQHVDSHLRLGIALADLGQMQQAVPHFEEAVRLAPDQPESHLNLGISLLRLREPRKANQHFRRALELDPNNMKAAYGLATGLYQLEQWSQAEEQFRTVLELAPDFAPAHTDLGKLLLKQGRRRDAIWHFREALRIQPGLVEAQIHLEQATKNRDDARD